MKKLTIILFGLLIPMLSISQDCPYYETYIKKGDKALQEEDFLEAINHYNTAIVHCPDNTEVVQKKILKVFEAIDKVKEEAEKAAEEAIRMEKKAIAAQLQTEEAARKTEEALIKSKEAEAVANRLKEKADSTARISQLITAALEVQTVNPTLAINLAKYAYNYSGKQNKSAIKIISQLFTDKDIGLVL